MNMKVKELNNIEMVSMGDVRENLADIVNRVFYTGTRICLQRRGKPIAGLVSVDDMIALQKLQDETDLKAARKALKKDKFISLAKVKKDLGL